jgi:hypothetical protein
VDSSKNNEMKNIILITAVLSILLPGCKSSNKLIKNEIPGDELVSYHREARAIIYKTNGNFSDKVPVIMNEERTKIVSFPAPQDLLLNGKPVRPSLLNQGYLLDNRGINERVAFLTFSYDIYSKLESAPEMEVLMANILEKYPLLEMYDCGKRSEYTDLIRDINVLIDRGLTNCKKLDLIPMGMTL